MLARSGLAVAGRLGTAFRCKQDPLQQPAPYRVKMTSFNL